MEKTINKDALAVQVAVEAIRRSLGVVPMEVNDAAKAVQAMLFASAAVADEQLRHQLGQALTMALRLRIEVDEQLSVLQQRLDQLSVLTDLAGALL